MDEITRATRVGGQEPALLEAIGRLDRLRRDRRAVHVRFSKLRPHHRLDYQLRAGLAAVEDLTRRCESTLFRLHDGDAMLVVKGAEPRDIDATMENLRSYFGNDPVLWLGNGAPDAFIVEYELERDYDRLMQVCQELEEARRKAAAVLAGAGAKAPGGWRIQVGDLLKVSQAIREADLSVVLRRQPVVFSSPSQPPIPLFQELFISTVDLSRIVLPGCSLTADRWLFQHLTEILDQRMLALLKQRREPALAGDFSLNLNVATVLSEDFMTFDREVVAGSGSHVMIELQLFDILSDPGAYMFARELLRERSYKICLDGVKHGALPLVDRERLGVDLVKVQWNSSLIEEHAGPEGAELAEAAARIGCQHLILCRCDSPKVLQVGRSMGIALYQGRYFDAVLQKMKETPTAVRAVPA